MASDDDLIYGLLDMGEGYRILHINCIRASGLLKKDLFGLSDPYCRIAVCEEGDSTEPLGLPAETKAIKRSLNPNWDQIFRFRVNPSAHHTLLFEVYDYNKLISDDFLGQYRFKLFQLPVNNTPVDFTSAPVHSMKLGQRSTRSRVRGHLYCQFMYEPQPDALSVDSAPAPEDEEIQSGQWESLQEEGPLPDGWEEREDFSGRLVYVDHVNRVVSLDRPTEPARLTRDRPSVLQRQHSSFENRRQISEDVLEEQESVLESLVAESGAGEQTASQAEEDNEWETLRENESAGDLPDGWELSHDFGGRPLYVNHLDRTTSYERPTTAAAPQASFEHLSVEEATPSAPSAPTLEIPEEEEEETETDAESPLPGGWTRGRDPNSGRVFYIDHNSRTTSWTKPQIQTDGLYAALGPLPSGWEMRNTKNGRPFFINHRTKETTWHDPRQSDPLPDGWEMRVHPDGRVFYVDHTTKSTQWEDPRITQVSSGPAIQYSRDYKIKYENFKANLPKPTTTTGKCEITVKRANILVDSFTCISSKPGQELLRRLWITFQGEPGLDYGGVAREWFYLLSREMFNPYYGLFEYSAIDNYTLQINPNSGLCDSDHLRFFHFFGRVCALAVYHGKLVDGFFIRPFYKMLLNKQVTLEDMAEVDIETYNSLKWVIDNDPEDLCLTFSAQEDKFGEIIETPLVTNGENITVTNFNKEGYVKAYIRWKFVDRIEEQMKHFISGFSDIIPISKLAVFDENEMEYLMCGITQIDVDDWAQYTEFKGGYSPTHHVIVWFWKAVRSFDNEFRARLLQFVTGTSRVPMNGFRELQGSNGPQRFCIEKWGENENLPRAHTCFNRIDLPAYSDYHVLREKLRVAVECTGGFEID